MTEENNQTATDQPVQPVQEEMTTIYASTNAVPFATMLIPKKWAKIGNVYPMTTIEPDPSLKSPKMDWNEMKWFENDNAQKGIDMENLKQEVDTLNGKGQESNTEMDQLIKLVTMTNTQVGALMGKTTGSTTNSQPSQSTTSSTTQPTVPATGSTTNSQPSQPAAASTTQQATPATQPTQPSTATEGGKK